MTDAPDLLEICKACGFTKFQHTPYDHPFVPSGRFSLTPFIMGKP